jgi:sensor histidine kinase YesM
MHGNLSSYLNRFSLKSIFVPEFLTLEEASGDTKIVQPKKKIISSMSKPVFLNKNLILVFAAWWAFWIFIQYFVLRNYNIHPGTAATDSIISILLLAACCLVPINNMRYYLPKHEKYWYIITVSIVLSLVWILAIRILLGMIFYDDAFYLNALQQSIYVRFAFAVLMNGCIATISLSWFTQQEQQRTEEQKTEMEQSAKDAELSKLRQQLQPHFLFNSLNSISALTLNQPEKARHMIQQLSDYLRSTIRKENLSWSSIKEEIEYLNLYLEIEKIRFGDRLQTEINVEEDCLESNIPAFLLQPVIENAIKFGLYDTTAETTVIRMEVKKTIQSLNIIIQNPFDEETSQGLHGTGFGLASVKKRLYLLFGRNDLLVTKKENGIFYTTIQIPVTT